MPAEEVTRLLRELTQDGARTLERRYSPEALANIQDLREAVRVRVQENATHVSAWEAFEHDPVDAEAELTGALEALFEADAQFAARVNAFMEEHHRLVAPPSAQAAAREAASGADVGVTPPATRTVPEPRGDVAPEDEAPPDVEGTYLYGATTRAAAEVGRGIGHGEAGPAPQEPGTPGAEAPEATGDELLSTTFDDLYDAIEGHPNLSEEEKLDLQAALQEIQRRLVAATGRSRPPGQRE